MASNFPTSLDSFTDPTSGSSLASPSHSGQHIDLNDAVEKLEAKLGIGSSPASSAVNGSVLVANGSGSTTWTNRVGLWLITTAQVTAQSELVVDSCYSSSYTNYLLIVRLQTSASDSFYQNRVSGNNAATNYNRQLLEAQATTVGTSRATGQTSFVFTSNSNGAFWQTAEASIFAPALAEPTGIQINHCRTDGAYTVPSAFMIYGNHSTATAYDGFRIFTTSGTLTGKVWVYGRRD